jgi:hypothetical protein
MKKALLLICLIGNMYSFAQAPDYCKDILKTGSELTQKVYYNSKAIWLNKNSGIRIQKVASPSISGMALILTNFAPVVDVRRKGIYIKFEDGTFYRDEKTIADVEVSDSNRFRYNFVLTIEPSMIDKFTTTKITDVNFGFSGDLTLKIEDSERLINYIVCCNSLK